MDGTSALTAISSVLTSTVKIAEKVFEICAVDDQAKAVLQTVNQVSSQLVSAKTLRRQKSALFSTFEKRMIDDTFGHTEEAIKQVAALAERARADMEVSGGKVRANTRLLFVLRDSPNIHVSLTKLSIASQSLNTAIFTLSCREGRAPSLPGPDGGGAPTTHSDTKPPPTYEESMFLSSGRRRNIERRASAMTLKERYKSESMDSRPTDLSANIPERTRTVPLHDKRIPFDFSPFPPPPPENFSELPATEYLFDKKETPHITVVEFPSEKQAFEFVAFSPSNESKPGRPTTYQAYNPKPDQMYNCLEFESSESFIFPSEQPSTQRPRAWSGRAGQQADELYFEACSPLSPTGHISPPMSPPMSPPISPPSTPAERTLSGRARSQRWLQARCQ